VAERWIRDHFGSEVRPRGEFVRGLEAELSAAWPAQAVAPAEVDATRPDESDVWDIAHADQEPAPVRRRGVWLLAAAMVVLAGVGVVYVTTSDRGGGVATTPGSTAPGPTATLPSTVPGDGVVPADPSPTVAGSGVPSSGATAQSEDPVFDPACVPRPGVSAGGPSLPASAFDSFAPLQPQPVLTVRLPRLREPVAGNGSAYASATVIATDGVVITLQSNGDTAVDGSMTAFVSFDGTVRWVHCSIDGAGDTGPVPSDYTAVLETTSPSIGAASGIMVAGFLNGESLEAVAGVDPDGNVVWRRDDVRVSQVGGFSTAVVGDVTVVEGELDPQAGRSGVFAVRTTTGETVWEREGARVALEADGLLLLFDGVIVDGATGEVVQSFADAVDFELECCGDSFHRWLHIYGGVLVHNDDDTMRVWLPAALDLPPHEVSLR